MASLITYPDKSPGDQFLSSEANEIKTVINANAVETEANTATNARQNHEVLLRGVSYNTQAPSGLGLPIQIEFGAGQGTGADPVMIDALGTLTFNEAGIYEVIVNLGIKRLSVTGLAFLIFKAFYNGVGAGVPIGFAIDHRNETVSAYFSQTFSASAGDYLSMEMARDESGVNDGQISPIITTGALISWGNVPSALARVTRVG